MGAGGGGWPVTTGRGQGPNGTSCVGQTPPIPVGLLTNTKTVVWKFNPRRSGTLREWATSGPLDSRNYPVHSWGETATRHRVRSRQAGPWGEPTTAQ